MLIGSVVPYPNSTEFMSMIKLLFYISKSFRESCYTAMDNQKMINSSFLWLDFPGGSEVKASACNAGDLGLVPGSGRSPEEGNSNPLQYSCLENPMDGGAWWATVHRVAESDKTELTHVSVGWL